SVNTRIPRQRQQVSLLQMHLILKRPKSVETCRGRHVTIKRQRPRLVPRKCIDCG
ncbi:hypothetical protein H0H93_006494, partial [Arthromyces matolae]